MVAENRQVDACLAHDRVDSTTDHSICPHCLLYVLSKRDFRLIVLFRRRDLSDAPWKEKTFWKISDEFVGEISLLRMSANVHYLNLNHRRHVDVSQSHFYEKFLWRFLQLTFHSFMAEKLIITGRKEEDFHSNIPVNLRRARLLVFVNSLFSFDSIRFFFFIYRAIHSIAAWMRFYVYYVTKHDTHY